VKVEKIKSGVRNLGVKKSHYKSESSSSSSSSASSLEESSRNSSHEDNDSESQDSSSSSHKKSKKSKLTTTTALRSIQLPKEKSSNKEKIVKSPSQKILSLLNTADEDKLKQRLACIGPKRAQQIVKYREKNGLYSSITDLTQLEGIGSKWVKSFIESNQDI
jgi:competence ComEA-like helix-hairpin-helix protein